MNSRRIVIGGCAAVKVGIGSVVILRRKFNSGSGWGRCVNGEGDGIRRIAGIAGNVGFGCSDDVSGVWV